MVIITNIGNECNRCFKYFVQNNKYNNFKLNEKNYRMPSIQVLKLLNGKMFK